MSLLEVKGLEVRYGGIRAAKGVDLTVAEGELVCLIGANGAGKTSTLKAICGMLPVAAGSVQYAGEAVTGVPSFRLVRKGLVLVPEGRGIFGQLTVAENLAMGAFARDDAAEVKRDFEKMLALFPRLAERSAQSAGTLSGGEQQMLAIGRALMGNPRVLLMDEPSEGLAPQLVAEVGRTIAQLKAEGQSIILVEQNIKLTLALADDVVIINTGRVVFAGAAAGIKLDDAIVSQHLGVF